MKIIRTAEDYDAALERVAELMTAKKGTPEGDELEVLSLLIETYEKAEHPIDLPSPIEAIKFRMDQAGLRQRDLIPYIGSSAKVSEVLKGTRPLTIQMMKALHRELGIPAEVFLGMNADVVENPALEPERLPWAEIVKRGWVPDFEGTYHEAKRRASELFVKVFHPSAAKCLAPARYRRSIRAASPMDEVSVSAWTARVVTLACRQELPTRFIKGSVNKAFMGDLVKLSFLDDGPRLAQEYLRKHGIHLIVESHLPKTKIDGAATMLDNGHPVIGLTLRYDRLDNFWFNLAHELGHVALHFNEDDVLFVDDFQSEARDQELEADEWAREALIPSDVWNAIGPLRTELAVKDLAVKLSIHPAIIAGRMRFESNNFRLMTDLVGQGQVRHHFH